MQTFPLLSTQSGIWLADQVTDRNNLFAIAHNVEICGPLDPALLCEAIRIGMSEADSITATYSTSENGPVQTFGAIAIDDIPVEILDLQSEPDPIARMEQITQDDLARDLSLESKQPLGRHVIMRLADKDGQPHWIWYQRYHHIMLDGYSFTTLTRRTADIYTSLIKGEAPSASPYQGTEAVLAEYETYKNSKGFERDKAFWSDYCADLPPVSRLPSDTQTNPTNTILTEIRTLDTGSVSALESINQNVAAVDLLISTVAVYLAHMSGQSEQVIGVPFMRRMGSAAISSSAPVVTILPLRIKVDPNASIAHTAEEVAATMRKLRRHQRYDTVLIQRDIGLVGTGRRLFGPLVNYRMFDYELKFGDLSGITHHLATGPVEDIEFGLLTENNQISLELRADGNLYSQNELADHASRLQSLLETFVQTPNDAISHVDILSHTDKNLLARYGTITPVSHTPAWNSIIDAFCDQVTHTPDATALVFGTKSLTYQEMSDQVLKLAHYLRTKGLAKGDVVAVALPRSEQCVITTFAVMAAGCVHVPIDINYPSARIQDIFETAQPKLVLTSKDGDQGLGQVVEKFYLDDAENQDKLAAIQPNKLDHIINGKDAAYIIFTSGSTGRPKGVVIKHASLLNLFKAERDLIYIPALAQVWKNFSGRPLRAAHTHTFAFDSYWLMLFWVLLGQEVHILDEDIRRDAHALALAVHDNQYDSLDLTPSLCAQMVESGLLEDGRHHPTMITVGGEAMPASLWETFNQHPNLQAWNAYGPTEFTVDAVVARMSESDQPVIGHPLAGLQALVLDKNLNELPPGCIGELYLAGAGMAAGYFNRPDLTAQRFVVHPFKDGQTMYRTGDLVRYNKKGQLEYLGRSDHQVKIRGFRIEISEIEMAIDAQEGVARSMVIVEDLGHIKRLVAYCYPQPDMSLDEQVIREQLQEKLPDYMVPAALVVLDEFPLTPIGKIDRDRLPSPKITVNLKPETAQEHLVTDQVASLLKLPEVGVEADFFALGGDSITAMVLCNQMRKNGYMLSPRDIFEGKSLKAIARRLSPLDDTIVQDNDAPILPADTMNELTQKYGELDEVIELLPAQKGVLFQAQSQQGGGQYNSHSRLYLRGDLNKEKLQSAFNSLLQKHTQLAGLFNSQITEEPLLILPKQNGSETWPWQDHDLTHMPVDQQETAVLKIEENSVNQDRLQDKFCQLISTDLIKLEDDLHVLIVVIHHIIIDGWSAPILLRELFSAYQQGKPDDTTPANYARVVRQLLKRDPVEARDAWQQALTGVEATRLFDHIKPLDHVKECEFTLDRDTSQALMKAAKQQGLTLNSLMQAVWGTVLGSMMGRNDIVFGTPTAGRSAPIAGIEDQIGMFLNTIPVRVTLNADQPLWDQAKTLQDQQIKLMAHDELGLADIQQIAGDGTLFDTLLVVENYPDFDGFLRSDAGLKVEKFHNRGYSHYPLCLVVLPGDEIRLLVQDRGAISDMDGLAKRVGQVLKSLVQSPSQKLASLDMATAEDMALIAKQNETRHDLPALTVRDLLLAQVGRTPDAPALLDENHHLTYRQLRHQVLELAAHLRKQGVKRGDVVCVALERSARLNIALQAITEIGGVFLPLDLSYPTQRLDYMVTDSKPHLIICEEKTRKMFSDSHQVLMFETLFDPSHEVRDLEDPGIQPDDPCYILYTSGTTGNPKGVVVSHKALVNYLLWVQDVYPLYEKDTVLQKTPCGFDVSLTEFFWPLICGAQLVMGTPDAHRDTAELIRLIDKYQVTFTDFVPSMFALFVQELKTEKNAKACQSLRQLILVGEALARDVVKDFAKVSNAEVLNLYGPTEATIEITHASATKSLNDTTGNIPIGRPAWNSEMRILDHYLRPVPAGVAGELYLCGDQLALGYLNRADLSASRFVADPLEDGKRMYRTGDLACWREDGQLDYLGRVDDQIKIAGQRVELGEIEAQIKSLGTIDQAVVIAAKTKNDTKLVAYVTGDVANPHSLLAKLGEVLPQHMIPATIVPLDEMPLNATGKLDRKALPKPELDTRQIGRAPAGDQELPIAQMFKDLLGVEQVGAQEDFFAIGGHSLMAMKLAARIRRQFKVQVSVGQIIANPSIEKLAEHLFLGERVSTMVRDGFDQYIKFKEGQGSTLVCFYPGSGISWKFNVLSRHLPDGMGLAAFQSPRPNGPIATSKTIEELCDKQLDQLLTHHPTGPYYLLGYSIGGGIAYGLAVRLKALGHEVRFVGMLDTYPRALGAKGGLNQFENMIMQEMQGSEDDELQEERAEILAHLLDNIRDANRLVSNGAAPKYDDHVTLFSAGQTRPANIDPQKVWEEYANSAEVFDFPERTHFDIMSPASMEKIGPIIARLLHELQDQQSEIA